MADFTLTVKTDSSAELLDIVARIANSMPLPTGKSALAHGEAMHAEINKQLQAYAAELMPDPRPMGAPVPVEVIEKAEAAGQAVIDEIAPVGLGQDTIDLLDTGRDGHGIKRDDRIHANAADPFKADGTWKRRKNVPDEQYEEIHLELVREAKAAGLYTGPAIPELELEYRVVDTEQQTGGHILASDPAPVTVTVENRTDAQLVVTQEPEAVTVTAVAPPAPAPAPVPAAPAAPGMSAEATPTYQQAVVALFNAGGPTAPQVALQAMGLTIATQATPQQLRDMVTAAEMVTALGIAPADKPTKGPEHTRDALAALGYVA